MSFSSCLVVSRVFHPARFGREKRMEVYATSYHLTTDDLSERQTKWAVCFWLVVVEMR